jgi:hypothetical protein
VDDDEEAEGWYLDPYGVHEQRWISRGRPSNLVRDGNKEAKDEPPDHPASHPFVPIPSDSAGIGFRDMQRADDVANQPVPASGFYADVAQDANVAYDSSGSGSVYDSSLIRVPAPSGLPSNAPLTPFQRKMAQRARKKRREERWGRWFHKSPEGEGEGTKP